MGTKQQSIKDTIFSWQMDSMRLNFEVKPEEHFLEIRVQNTNKYTAVGEAID